MDIAEYKAKMLKLVRKDYAIMMKMLENIDPNTNPINEETLPAMEAVEAIFIEAIKKNITGLMQFQSLMKVLTDKELLFDEETLDWTLDTTLEEEDERPSKNIYS